MSSGRTGTRLSSRPVAFLRADRIAAVETTEEKRTEWEEYRRVVTLFERERYLGIM